jgi:glycosyltransferase involved in cell wall biosynthesis
MKNKIIIIANGFQEDYIVNLVQGLSNFCEVEFIGSSIYLKYAFNSNVKIINLRGEHTEDVSKYAKFKRVLKYYFKLIQFLIFSKIKVVHIQWLRFNFIDGVALSLFARMIGKKVIYTAHDVVPHNFDTKYNRFLFHLVYYSQNSIIVHTDFIKQRLINEFKVKKDKINIVKHGVYDVFRTPDMNSEIARTRLGFKTDDFIILFFGIISEYKGIKLLLEAFNKLSIESDKTKLVIAGRIQKGHEESIQKILTDNANSNITTKIHYIENEEVEILFKASNVCVLPYLEASQSGVLFLSYGYGIPVIAPILGGFPDDVAEGKTGLLFETGNELSLIEAIRKAIVNFNFVEKEFNQNIKTFAYDNYSWNSSCEKLNTIYFNKPL